MDTGKCSTDDSPDGEPEARPVMPRRGRWRRWMEGHHTAAAPSRTSPWCWACRGPSSGNRRPPRTPPGEGFALGLLFAAIPVGAVAAGLLSGTFSRARRHGWMVIAAVVVRGGSIAGFGISAVLWAAVLFPAVAGFAAVLALAAAMPALRRYRM